ncbi:MAG: amino acid permease [Gammaproteobacteria bacterium]|nr:MAG: amino acid permease [Gammaproteobacteria bacterium]
MSSKAKPTLKRALSLPMMVLYGLGTTIGAGIYALVGELASVSGYLAPFSFLVAAFTAALTAMSYAELSGRYPRAAGVALYVKAGLSVETISIIAGLLVVITGIVSSSALVNGFIGYLGEFIELPRLVAITIVVIMIGIIAAWGIAESVTIAATVTVIEVSGLLLIVIVGHESLLEASHRWQEMMPSINLSSGHSILAGVLLAFYAFIGFEDMVDVAEEVKDVRHILPLAILLTLLITMFIYILVMITALMSMPPDQLALTDAPLAMLYEYHTGEKAVLIGLIGMFAIINGALIQVIMASRVLYGMSSRKQLPAFLSRINAITRTPLLATVIITLTVLIVSSIGNLAALAELTSVIMLTIFAIVNLSLMRIKLRHPEYSESLVFPFVVPLLGFIVSSSFVLKDILDILERLFS